MEFLRSLFRFLASTGRPTGETAEERRERRRLDRRGKAPPRVSGIAAMFFVFVALAIVVKLVIEGLGGGPVDLDIASLTKWYVLLLVALMVVGAVALLRRLWPGSEVEPAEGAAGGGGGCGMVVLVLLVGVGLLGWYVRHSYEVSLEREEAAARSARQAKRAAAQVEVATSAGDEEPVDDAETEAGAAADDTLDGDGE